MSSPERCRRWRALNVASASGSEIVRRASVSRIQLLREQRTVLELVKQAGALETASERRLRELQALAESTSQQLLAAQSALQRARGAEAARRAARAKAAERARLARMATMFGGPDLHRQVDRGTAERQPRPRVAVPALDGWRCDGRGAGCRGVQQDEQVPRRHCRRTAVRDRRLPLLPAAGRAVPRRSPGWPPYLAPATTAGARLSTCAVGCRTSAPVPTTGCGPTPPGSAGSTPSGRSQSGSRPEAWHWEFVG